MPQISFSVVSFLVFKYISISEQFWLKTLY